MQIVRSRNDGYHVIEHQHIIASFDTYQRALNFARRECMSNEMSCELNATIDAICKKYNVEHGFSISIENIIVFENNAIEIELKYDQVDRATLMFD